MPRSNLRSPALAIAAVTLTLATAGSVLAQGYYRGGHGHPGYVVAESRYGKGTVQGAVRHGRTGPQVQMPGGTWIDCVRSCSETLRRQTVDYWESNGPHAKDTGPGYFTWGFGWR